MFSLPIPLLLVFTIVGSFLASITRGAYSKKVNSTDVCLWMFNFAQSISCALMIMIIIFLSNGIGSFSLCSVILGIALGIVSVYGLDNTLKAFAVGPFSYTTVIISLSAIIPTLSGYFFGETVSLIQYIGIGLMVVCIVLSPEKKDDSGKKVTGKWLVYCLIASVFSGVVGIVQKIHQISTFKDEMAALLITCFGVSALISGIKVLILSYKQKQEKAPLRKGLFFPIISGLAFAFPHTVNLYLAGKLPAAVMFPLVNLCPMIFSMILGMILFKERLSLVRWIGVIVGIIAAVFVSGIL